MQTLQPITTAPKDGTPVLLKIKPDQGSFSNLVFVGRNGYTMTIDSPDEQRALAAQPAAPPTPEETR